MSLRRSKGLRPDPETVLEWQRRSRDRARERRKERAPRRQRRRKARIGLAARRRVLARSRGLCAPCLARGRERRAVQVHHVLDEQHFPEVATNEDNLVGCCVQCNQNHHFKPGGHMPRAALPPCSLRLALRLGPRAERWIERFYPDEGPRPAAPGDDGGGGR